MVLRRFFLVFCCWQEPAFGPQALHFPSDAPVFQPDRVYSREKRQAAATTVGCKDGTLRPLLWSQAKGSDGNSMPLVGILYSTGPLSFQYEFDPAIMRGFSAPDWWFADGFHPPLWATYVAGLFFFCLCLSRDKNSSWPLRSKTIGGGAFFFVVYYGQAKAWWYTATAFFGSCTNFQPSLLMILASPSVGIVAGKAACFCD